MSKPIFKYIGGKTWLRKTLQESLYNLLSKNNHINQYCEPFVGGLGSFLSNTQILSQFKISDIQLSDINDCLIQTYIDVQKKPNSLIEQFLLIENQFLLHIPNNWQTLDKNTIKINLEAANNFFKKTRTEYNALKSNPSTHTSALFLFLQKHSFNGIYRENSKGEYNTPFNWSGTSFLQIEKDIKSLHKTFNDFNITFSTTSFEHIQYSQNCLYYLDPPYINLEIAENKYNKNEFTNELQLLLIEKIKNSPFIYSNHSTTQLLAIFNEFPNTLIQEVFRKNLISSKAVDRAQEKSEILVSHWL